MASNTNGCPLSAGLSKIKMADFDMSTFVRPDQPSRCTWSLDDPNAETVHTVRPFIERPLIIDNICDAIGYTPMVKINRITKEEGVKCEVYAKCEYLNPGGSVKDRIGYRMVLDAEHYGLLTPGCTIIEPTSGNTGIGLAMACAVRGYKCIIVMPEKMSDEKVGTLKSLGAHIIRTPTEAAFDSPDSLISVAQRLNKAIPNSFILDQYRNSGNPLAHYDGTGAEILHQVPDVTMVVLGAGTGGTVTGVGRRIKEKSNDIQIVAVDPPGSILAQPESLNETDVTFYEVEGIGYDFIPTVLDRSVADKWVKVNDKASFAMAKRLQGLEGMLCGGSSGAAMHAAIEVIKQQNLDETHKVVVILPDSIRNYMSKFVIDSWLEARDLIESKNINGYPWWDKPLENLNFTKPETVTFDESFTQVMTKMNALDIEQIPVVDNLGDIKGMATREHALNKLLNDKLSKNDPILRFIYKQYIKVGKETTLGRISRVLERQPFVVITEKQNEATCNKEITVPVGIVTRKIFTDFLLS
jgi:cystathionine beta-synthase